jgi:hypothetical protein
MGMDIMQLGFKDGELPINPLITPTGTTTASPYFGGQPLAINTDGTVILALGSTPKYIGMAKNSSYEDASNGNATVVSGASKVVFLNGSNEVDSVTPQGLTVEGAPYDATLTYTAGDYLYIANGSGLWTNVSSSNGTPKGIIVKPPSSTDGTMHAYMFMVV